MADHSKLSPSHATRWCNCPGSVALSVGAPDRKSQFAAEGTVAHSLAEMLVTGKKDSLDLFGMVGDEVKCDGFEIEITDEMVDHAIEYHDIIKADWDLAETTRKPGAAEIRGEAEVKVHVSSVDPELWGTADFVLYQVGRFLSVYDYKYGKGKAVEAEGNDQLCTYTIGVLDKIGWSFESVRIVIIQPRAPHPDGPVREWVASIEYLKAFRERLRAAVAQTREKGAPLAAGEWCRWCPARARCPELTKAVQVQAQADFDVPVDRVPQIPQLPDPKLVPVAKLAAAFAWETAIEGWFEAVKLELRTRLEAGEDIPGVKLVDGRLGNRQWVDESLVVEKYGSTLGDEIWAKKLLSPAKLEVIVGKKNLDPGLVTRAEGRKMLVLSSDKRPTAKRSVIEDFASPVEVEGLL